MSRCATGQVNRACTRFAAASPELTHVTRGLFMKSINSIMRRIGVFPVALAWLFVQPLSRGQVPADSAAITPEIQVHAAAADRGELDRKVRILDTPCGGRSQYLDHPNSVGEFEGGKVRAIRVVRFAGLGNAPAQKELLNTVRRVWQGRFQSVSCYMSWDEATFWTVEAVVEFEDGRQGELITDGMHVALQGHNGKSWFFRLLPAAQ